MEGHSAGDVLVIARDRERDEDVRAALECTGRRVTALSCAECALLERGDSDELDLLVTAFEPADAASSTVLERLLSGDLFPGVPRLHVCASASVRDSFLGRGVDAAHVLVDPEERKDLAMRARLLAEIGGLARSLAMASSVDPLTGLFNRRYLMQRLDEEMSRARRYRTSLSLVLVDIDRLKDINDARGQAAGDSAIRSLSQLVRSHIRKEDVVGRTGEESYGVVLPGNRYRGAAVLANKIRTEVEQLLVPYRDEGLRMRVSAGISTFPDNPAIESADDLMSAAEDALAQAKSRGGNRVFIDEGALDRDQRFVLVADPDAALVDLAEDLLALDELRVIRADTARSALETLRFRRPDLLIVDLSLLKREPDVDLLERASELYPGKRVPVVGLGRDPGADPDKLQLLGVDRFLTKPFSLSVLRGLVRELIESGARRRTPSGIA
jgi:diguanylate cyclase (GGDEF)-like protein